MAKLYITPSSAARTQAARALEIRRDVVASRRAGLTTQEAGAQGIGSGVARARDIAAGKRVDAYQVLRFFQRFRGLVAEAQAQGLDARSSKAIQAWMLWGGEPLYRQAARAVERAKAKSASERRGAVDRYIRERYGV
jgi:hypothetical protein